MNRELQIRTTVIEGAAVVAPQGEVDLSTSPELRVALNQALATKPTAMIINLAGVPSIDSSGVATLIESMRETQHRKIPLILCSLETRVLAVLEIARLDRVFRIAADTDAAVAMAKA